MKHRIQLPVVLGLVLLASGGAAGYRWWRAGEDRQLIMSHRPVSPVLASDAPQELRDRLMQCDRQLQSGQEVRAGLVELSRLHHANGYIPEAVRCYQLLMQVEPRNAHWPHLLATLVAGYGQLEEAAPLWQRASALAPDYAPAGIRLGDVLLKLNDFERAAAVYQKVLKLPGEHPHALVGLARVDLRFGRREAAQEKLEAAAMQTNYRIGADLLTTVYEESGQAARAVEIRSRNKSSGSYSDYADPWVDELFADCYDVYRLQVAGGMAEHRGEVAAVMPLLKRALALAPNETGTLYQLGMFCLRQEKPAEARDYFQRCVGLRPDFPDGWAQLIGVLRRLGDSAGAEHALSTALVRCPKSPGLHLERARSLVAANRTDEAILEYRETIRLRPEEADPYVALATIYFNQDRVEEGMAELRNALKAEPDSPVALSTLAFAAISTGDQAEARRLLHRIRQQPRIPSGDFTALAAEYRNKFGVTFP